ncbi:hypothetical protein, conserved [Babesia ovata]|uniref:Extracellular matrix-binding ebh n=1 Tax=Babesia ovata TaxID=189622 RepID=A0A2H6KAH2_9APIC|nr:uncharacterized protein BOVATA_014850 [Babesia ovata]GBE59992.1 hypothetical protein, conserved [Babesia ovata]
MAFLHGVIKNVHDKQPYKVGKDYLNENVVKLVEPYLCSGHEGFKRVIGQVAQGVGRYNRDVEGSNERVKRPIEKLQGFVKEGSEFDNSVKNLPYANVTEEHVKRTVKLVAECRENARLYVSGTQLARQEINDLNRELNVKINNAYDVIYYQYDRLVKVSRQEKSDLDEATKRVREVLEAAGDNLKSQISSNIKSLVADLKKLVDAIKTKLDSIKENLEKYVAALDKWITAALAVIQAAEDRITEDILPKVSKGKEYAQTPIGEAAKDLQTKGENLLSAYETSFNGLDGLKRGIEGAVRDVEQVYEKKLLSLKKGVIEGVNKALEDGEHGLTKLDDHVKGGLINLRDRLIKQAIDGFVEQLERTNYESSAASLFIRGGGATGSFSQLPDTKLKSWIDKVKEDLEQSVIHIPVHYRNGEDKLKHLMGVLDGIKKEIKILVDTQLKPTSFFGAIGTDIHGKITKVIEGNQKNMNLETLMKDYYAKTKKDPTPDGRNVGQLRGLIMTIKAPFKKDGFSEDEAFEKFDAQKMDGYKFEKVIGETGQGAQPKYDAAVKKVNKALKAFVDTNCVDTPSGTTANVNEKKKELSGFVETITTELKNIAWLVDNDASDEKPSDVKNHEQGGIRQRLQKLKADIGKDDGTSRDDKKLQGIRNKLHDLKEKDLAAVIGMADAFAGQADTFCGTTVENLNNSVDSQVHTAIDALTAQARKRYVATIQDILMAFADKVEKELKTLPQDINHDLTVGYKGFMKTLEDGSKEPSKRDSESINRLTDLVSLMSSPSFDKKAAFIGMCSAYQLFFRPITEYLLGEIVRVNAEENKKNQKPSAKETLYTNKLHAVFNALSKLVDNIKHNHGYDYKVPGLCEKLRDSIVSLKPYSFAMLTSPILDVIVSGVDMLEKELSKVYISAYSGNTYDSKDENAYAKICLSIISIVNADLAHLNKMCETDACKFSRICELNDGKENPLGTFLTRFGYSVPKGDGSGQDGELRCSGGMIGGHILQKLNVSIDGAKAITHLTTCSSPKNPREHICVMDIVQCFATHLTEFSQVGHIAAFTANKHPCNVYEMLGWLGGLPNNRVYEQLKSHIKTTLDKPEKYKRKDFSEIPEHILGLKGYPYNVSYRRIIIAIRDITYNSHTLLTTIAGHGDAECGYACDYSNNSLNLHYPTSGADCLDMLLDILRRLHYVLKFLHNRCGVAAKHSGWRDCMYGKDIPTTKAHCNEQPTNQPNCQPRCQANCHANTKPNCQPTSPLMNYLSDSLPGHLPHQLITVGCKPKCTTCPTTSRLGMPCLTPLGFRGFSGSTKTGENLYDSIEIFFNIRNLTALFALAPRPPSTLPEHFGFALSLAMGLNATQLKKSDDIKTLQDAFAESATRLSITLYERPGDLTDALTAAYGSPSAPHSSCDGSHLMHLTESQTCSNNIYSAPYLQSLCQDYTYYLANKHTGAYLSWVVYLPWDFFTFLGNLYNAFCNIFCQEWGCRKTWDGHIVLQLHVHRKM